MALNPRYRKLCETLCEMGVFGDASMRADAAESVYFARELETIRTKLHEVKYPENKAFTFMSIAQDIDPADDTFTDRTSDMVGSADLGSDYSMVGPNAEVFDREESAFIRPIKNGYQYSFHDALRSARYNKRLPERKAMAARRAIANKLDDVLLLGDGTAPYLKLRGLFKLSGTDTYATPVSAVTGSKTWALKTPLEILADLTTPFRQIIVNTKEAWAGNRLILPVSGLEQLKDRTMGDGNNKSILQEFKERRPEVTIQTSIKLETAGTANSRRFVAYNDDSEVVEGIVPVEFEQLPPQVFGYNIITLCHARTGGVRNGHPKAVCYGDEF
jgi:hypothetical protein